MPFQWAELGAGHHCLPSSHLGTGGEIQCNSNPGQSDELVRPQSNLPSGPSNGVDTVMERKATKEQPEARQETEDGTEPRTETETKPKATDV